MRLLREGLLTGILSWVSRVFGMLFFGLSPVTNLHRPSDANILS